MQKLSASLVAIFLQSFFTLQADVIDDYAPGRSGEALKNTIYRQCRPSLTVDEQRLVEYLFQIYEQTDGLPYDGLTGKLITEPDFSRISYIVPVEWMKPDPKCFAEASVDLHNMLISDGASAIDRGQLPLGETTDGYDCYIPPEEMKGDIARAIFYIASLYPCQLWGNRGRYIFDNTPYPTLRSEWSDMYMRWHVNDPVDEWEKARDKKIAELQGNNNPFVTHPELADYLWGTKAGETYRPSTTPDNPDKPDKPDDPYTRIPLQESYNSSDPYIWLYSPYVPKDVTWSLDGKRVTERVSVSSLSIGNHELRFTSGTAKGKLIIEIKP